MANNKDELVVTLSLVSLNLVKTTISRAIYTETKSSRVDNNLCVFTLLRTIFLGFKPNRHLTLHSNKAG